MDMVQTWSIAFVNGRINRVELVFDSEPTTPDYVEMEIVADLWRSNHDTIEVLDIDPEVDLVAEEEAQNYLGFFGNLVIVPGG